MNFGALTPWRSKSEVTAPRQDYFDPLVTFRREVQRMMDDFFSANTGRGSEFGSWQGGLPVDVSETDKELIVSAELPGLDQKDFEVTVAGDVLTIKGEKKHEHEDKNGNGYYRERQFGSFYRSIRLPFEVKDESVDARYRNGVLTVHLPKPADSQLASRRIEVKAA